MSKDYEGLILAERRMNEMMDRINNVYRMAIKIATGPLPTAKCPFCGDYSLTYDWSSHQFTCHTYGAVFDAVEFG